MGKPSKSFSDIRIPPGILFPEAIIVSNHCGQFPTQSLGLAFANLGSSLLDIDSLIAEK